jgi:hypothetical protein
MLNDEFPLLRARFLNHCCRPPGFPTASTAAILANLCAGLLAGVIKPYSFFESKCSIS